MAMVHEITPTSLEVAEEAARGAAMSLINFLIDCARKRGDERYQEAFVFWGPTGEPSLVKAREFAEGIRDMVRAAKDVSKNLGVRQSNHQVVVRFIGPGDRDRQDAVVSI